MDARKTAATAGGALLALLIIGCGAGGTATVSTQEPTSGASAGSSAAAAQEEFTTRNLKLKDDGFGDFSGTVRVTNNGEEAASFVTVDVTLLDGKSDVVATLNGIVEAIPAGKTVTVRLLSTDRYTRKWETAETVVTR